MGNLISEFHSSFKSEFSKKYYKEVFDEMFEPTFDTNNGWHFKGSGIKYHLLNNLHMEMLEIILKFAKKKKISFTIGYFEPVELIFYIGDGEEFRNH